MAVSPKRHLAKAVTWRIIASVVTALIALYFGLPQKAVGAVFVADLIIKFVLQYGHERIWCKFVSFGLTGQDSEQMNGLEWFHNLWRGTVDNRPEQAVEPAVEQHEEPLAVRIKDDVELITPKGNKLTVGEIRHSNRISKSATPKYDASWYIKWVASAFILTSAVFRIQGPEWNAFDQLFSFVGVSGWMIVGFLWNDRALIMLNAVLMVILASGLLSTFGA